MKGHAENKKLGTPLGPTIGPDPKAIVTTGGVCPSASGPPGHADQHDHGKGFDHATANNAQRLASVPDSERSSGDILVVSTQMLQGAVILTYIETTSMTQFCSSTYQHYGAYGQWLKLYDFMVITR